MPLRDVTSPSIPPASPHRLGHYSGLHPEDQPYQSGFIAVQHPASPTHEDEEEDGSLPSFPHVVYKKEPQRLLLPNVAPDLEDVPTQSPVPPRALHATEQLTTRQKPLPVAQAEPIPATPMPFSKMATARPELHTRKLSNMPLGVPEYRVHGLEQVAKRSRSARVISLLLTLSLIFFLLASGILAFVLLKQHNVFASPVLEANPSLLRTNDTFVLTGRSFDANTVVKFTHDASEQPVVDVRNQPMTTATDSKGNFSVQIVVPTSWSVGEHSVHATDEAQALSRTTTITVQQPPPTPPQLQLLSSTLDLGSDRAGTRAGGQATLTNVGGGQVSWRAKSDAAWLTASPTDHSYVFSGRALVDINIDRSHLQPKAYTGHVFFSQQESSNTAILTIKMAVQDAPAAPAALALSPTSLGFSATSTQSVPGQSVLLQNTGGQTLHWQATTTTNDGANWLTVSPSSGQIEPGKTQTLTVTAQAQQLAPSSYQGMIAFSGGASASLPVSLTVVKPGTLIASPSTLSASLTGSGTVQKTITLQNSGQQAASWSASSASANAASWLIIAPPGGTVEPNGQAQVVVTLTSSNLNAGVYQGTVTIQGQGVSSVIPVSLTVIAAPAAIISLQSTSMTFTTSQGNDPISQDIGITNTGNATLNWSATESGNGQSFAPLSATSDSLAPQQTEYVSVYPSVSSYPASTLTTTITIADSDAGTTVVSQRLTLTIVIQKQAAIGISPQTNFNMGGANNVQAITITNTGSALLDWNASVQLTSPSNGGANGTATTNPITHVTSGVVGNVDVQTVELARTTSGSWLTIDRASGSLAAGESIIVHITCNGTGLAPGSYQGQITISDSDPQAQVTPRVIYITYDV